MAVLKIILLSGIIFVAAVVWGRTLNHSLPTATGFVVVAVLGLVILAAARLERRRRSRKYRPTGTPFGNPSVLDEVLEKPLSVPPGTGPNAIHAADAGVEAAIRQDIARDMISIGDEETASEEKLFDFFKRVGDKNQQKDAQDSSPAPRETPDA